LALGRLLGTKGERNERIFVRYSIYKDERRKARIYHLRAAADQSCNVGDSAYRNRQVVLGASTDNHALLRRARWSQRDSLRRDIAGGEMSEGAIFMLGMGFGIIIVVLYGRRR
jgi:hypothetical protein